MFDDRSESWRLLPVRKESPARAKVKRRWSITVMKDCLLHRSGQTSTEPGRNDIGAEAAISFLVNRLARMEELPSFYILRGEEYRLLHSGEER